MVLGRRHWKFLVLPLILMMLLTACERPLSSNDNDAAEATVVPETAEEESQEGEPDDAGSDPATGDVEADSEGETAEAETPAEEQEAEADSAGEESQEAESSDPEVGGGTPDTAAEEEAAEEATSEETTTDESASEQTAGDEEAVEGEETSETEAGDMAEADSSQQATDAATEDESTTEEAAEAESTTSIPATHTVAAGENLYRIGLKYGMSWVTLAAYNHLPNANYIRVGQVLNIPGGTAPPTQPPTTPPDEPGYTNYVVQRGDTLNSIGRKFGVSWVEIAEANGIVNPNLIYAGQVLKIPTDQPETPPTLTHTVQRGETLYRISLQYGVHWLAIAQANNIAPPYVIYPGQVLTIPSG